MQINYIFGVDNTVATGNNKVHRAFVISGGQTGLRAGTPCLVFMPALKTNDPDELIKKGMVSGVIPFSSYQNNCNRYRFSVGGDSPIVRVCDETDFIDRAITLEKDVFKVKDELPNIITNALDKATPTTVIIKTGKNLKTSLLDVNTILSSDFNYIFSTGQTKSGKHSLMPGETCLCCLTFANAKSVVPIFSSELKGIFMHCAIVYPKLSQEQGSLVTSYEFNVLYTNGTKGIKYVEGQDTGLLQASNDHVQSLYCEKESYFDQVGDSRPEKKEKKSGKGKPTIPKLKQRKGSWLDSHNYYKTELNW